MTQEWISIISAGIVLGANQILNIIRTQFQINRDNKKMEEVLKDFKELKNVLTEDIKILKAELTTNGGKSVKDRINMMVMELGKLSIIYEKKWHLQLDRDEVPIFVNDLNGDYIYVNKALSNLFKMSQEETIKNGWLKRIFNQSQAFHNWNEAVKNKLFYRDEYELVDDKGKKYAKCTAHSALQEDSEGNPLFFYGEITDIQYYE